MGSDPAQSQPAVFSAGRKGTADTDHLGREDAVVPVSAAEAYKKALKNTDVS